MGLVITASVVCDNDGITTASLQSADAPLPGGWMRVQGYANISGGDSEALDGYFCPACIAQNGTRALVKKTADISTALTAAPA